MRLVGEAVWKDNDRIVGFDAICANCSGEIGRLDYQEYRAMLLTPEYPLSPGLLCDRCFERQCDVCGHVAHPHRYRAIGSWRICVLCCDAYPGKVAWMRENKYKLHKPGDRFSTTKKGWETWREIKAGEGIAE